mgnify:CR=1 FL=1
MCRNITELRGLEPPANEAELHAAALQYIRKVTGLRQPPPAAGEAYDRAVAAVAEATAAVLAAIMSTSSSQLLVTSSALVEDLYKLVAHKRGLRPLSDSAYVRFGRIGVLAIAVIAVLLALSPSNSILDLVAFAWSGFGSAFGPAIILSLFWRRFTTAGALTGIVVGAVVAFAWGQSSLNAHLYGIVPAFATSFTTAIAVSLMTARSDPDVIDAEFDEATALARAPPPVGCGRDRIRLMRRQPRSSPLATWVTWISLEPA